VLPRTVPLVGVMRVPSTMGSGCRLRCVRDLRDGRNPSAFRREGVAKKT